MSFSEDFFSNKQYFLSTVAGLITDEKDRIVSHGLATREDVTLAVNMYIEKMRKAIANGQETNANHILDMYTQLQSVKLPGDFQKFVETEELSKTPEKTAEVMITETKADEVQPQVDPQMELAEKVINKLESIAYFAGAQGDHETAFVIEQTARNIKVAAEQGTLLNKETK